MFSDHPEDDTEPVDEDQVESDDENVDEPAEADVADQQQEPLRRLRAEDLPLPSRRPHLEQRLGEVLEADDDDAEDGEDGSKPVSMRRSADTPPDTTFTRRRPTLQLGASGAAAAVDAGKADQRTPKRTGDKTPDAEGQSDTNSQDRGEGDSHEGESPTSPDAGSEPEGSRTDRSLDNSAVDATSSGTRTDVADHGGGASDGAPEQRGDGDLPGAVGGAAAGASNTATEPVAQDAGPIGTPEHQPFNEPSSTPAGASGSGAQPPTGTDGTPDVSGSPVSPGEPGGTVAAQFHHDGDGTVGGGVQGTTPTPTGVPGREGAVNPTNLGGAAPEHSGPGVGMPGKPASGGRALSTGTPPAAGGPGSTRGLASTGKPVAAPGAAAAASGAGAAGTGTAAAGSGGPGGVAGTAAAGLASAKRALSSKTPSGSEGTSPPVRARDGALSGQQQPGGAVENRNSGAETGKPGNGTQPGARMPSGPPKKPVAPAGSKEGGAGGAALGAMSGGPMGAVVGGLGAAADKAKHASMSPEERAAAQEQRNRDDAGLSTSERMVKDAAQKSVGGRIGKAAAGAVGMRRLYNTGMNAASKAGVKALQATGVGAKATAAVDAAGAAKNKMSGASGKASGEGSGQATIVKGTAMLLPVLLLFGMMMLAGGVSSGDGGTLPPLAGVDTTELAQSNVATEHMNDGFRLAEVYSWTDDSPNVPWEILAGIQGVLTEFGTYNGNYPNDVDRYPAVDVEGGDPYGEEALALHEQVGGPGAQVFPIVYPWITTEGIENRENLKYEDSGIGPMLINPMHLELNEDGAEDVHENCTQVNRAKISRPLPGEFPNAATDSVLVYPELGSNGKPTGEKLTVGPDYSWLDDEVDEDCQFGLNGGTPDTGGEDGGNYGGGVEVDPNKTTTTTSTTEPDGDDFTTTSTAPESQDTTTTSPAMTSPGSPDATLPLGDTEVQGVRLPRYGPLRYAPTQDGEDDDDPLINLPLPIPGLPDIPVSVPGVEIIVDDEGVEVDVDTDDLGNGGGGDTGTPDKPEKAYGPRDPRNYPLVYAQDNRAATLYIMHQLRTRAYQAFECAGLPGMNEGDPDKNLTGKELDCWDYDPQETADALGWLTEAQAATTTTGSTIPVAEGAEETETNDQLEPIEKVNDLIGDRLFGYGGTYWREIIDSMLFVEWACEDYRWEKAWEPVEVPDGAELKHVMTTRLLCPPEVYTPDPEFQMAPQFATRGLEDGPPPIPPIENPTGCIGGPCKMDPNQPQGTARFVDYNYKYVEIAFLGISFPVPVSKNWRIEFPPPNLLDPLPELPDLATRMVQTGVLLGDFPDYPECGEFSLDSLADQVSSTNTGAPQEVVGSDSLEGIPFTRAYGVGDTVKYAYGNLPITEARYQLAKIVVDEVMRLGMGKRAAVIAISTVATESNIQNLEGGDRDSVGLYQQRPSTGWGTIAQARDPVLATQAFLGLAQHTGNTGLSDIDWLSMGPGEAAQTVQKSAHPERYDMSMDLAHGLVISILNGTGGEGTGVDPSNPGGALFSAAKEACSDPELVFAGISGGVAADLQEALEWAINTQQGIPYSQCTAEYSDRPCGPGGRFGERLGGRDPHYDCSGLATAIYRRIGIDFVPLGMATTNGMMDAANAGRVQVVDRQNIQPGDLLVWYGHVEIYIGNDQVIEASGRAKPSGIDTPSWSKVQRIIRPSSLERNTEPWPMHVP